MKNLDDDVIICQCRTPNHKIIISKDVDSVYVYFFLTHFPLLKRIMLGLKYIFGYKTRFGDFEEFILPNDDNTINKLTEIIEHVRVNKEITE